MLSNYNPWTNKDALDLVNLTKKGKAGYALSMWKEYKYRKNEYINYWSKNCKITDTEHFYFLGGPRKTERQ